MVAKSTPSESFTMSNLSEFYKLRTQKLETLTLSDVLGEMDSWVLIESVNTTSAPKLLSALTAKRLAREENRNWISKPSLHVIGLLRDAEVMNNSIEYETALAHAGNRLNREFITLFCDEIGNINWETVIDFNIGKIALRKT
jgi:hypothetical protein